MPISITTNSVTLPPDVSAAMRDLAAACRAWPSPLLNPHQFDHWYYVLGVFALLGLISIPMWLLCTYRLTRSCAHLISRLVNRGQRAAPPELGAGGQDD